MSAAAFSSSSGPAVGSQGQSQDNPGETGRIPRPAALPTRFNKPWVPCPGAARPHFFHGGRIARGGGRLSRAREITQQEARSTAGFDLMPLVVGGENGRKSKPA